ncbi:AraC family transcriptional regulator [Pseudomonadota bacterium]
MQFTFLASLTLPMWNALEENNCDSVALFRQAGLNIEKLRDPNARFPVQAGTRLANLAVAATGDPCFGLTVAKYFHPTTMHALGYSWMASDSLLDAFERLIRYYRLISNSEIVKMEEREDSYRVVLQDIDSRFSVVDPEADCFFAVILYLCRSLYGGEINPLRLTIRHKAPICAGQFQELFQSPVEFSASENAIYFNKEIVRKTLPTRNAELALVNDQVVTQYLAKFDLSQTSARVEAKILEQLSTGHVSQESVAKSLNLSVRSMQRRLKLEETSFKKLLTETRQHLARQYIEHSQLSINEITFLLGFSEPSNFSRAFRRWNGQPPSEYRSAVN